MTTPLRERWLQVRAEAPMLQARLALLGVNGPEQDAVIEETLIRVLRSQHVAVPVGVALFGMAIRVVSTRRGEQVAASVIANSASPEDRRIGQDADERVIAALEKVPFRLRAILVGVDLAQFTTNEVALTLGLALSEIEILLLEARSAFATSLKDCR